LFGRGHLEFESTLAAAFYQLLLRSTTAVTVALAGKAAKRKLAEFGDNPAHALKLRAIVLPKPTGHAPANQDSDSDICGGEPPLPKVLAVPKAVAAPAPIVDDDKSSSSSTSSSSSSSSSSDDSDIVGGFDVAPESEPEMIDGVKVGVEEHRKRGLESRGLRVVCPNGLHAPCSRFRSKHLDVAALGPLAASLYLKTWLSTAHSSSAVVHRSWRPKVKEIKAYCNIEG
jgi:hypothetical protein